MLAISASADVQGLLARSRSDDDRPGAGESSHPPGGDSPRAWSAVLHRRHAATELASDESTARLDL